MKELIPKYDFGVSARHEFPLLTENIICKATWHSEKRRFSSVCKAT